MNQWSFLSIGRKAGLLLWVGAALTTEAANPPTPPIRILPLGDSITYGTYVPGGYPALLYQLLTNAGYSVDFVGTQNGNGVAGLPDGDHEGYPGLADLTRSTRSFPVCSIRRSIRMSSWSSSARTTTRRIATRPMPQTGWRPGS